MWLHAGKAAMVGKVQEVSLMSKESKFPISNVAKIYQTKPGGEVGIFSQSSVQTSRQRHQNQVSHITKHTHSVSLRKNCVL